MPVVNDKTAFGRSIDKHGLSESPDELIGIAFIEHFHRDILVAHLAHRSAGDCLFAGHMPQGFRKPQSKARRDAE